jgi:hypothetical protein
MDGKCGRMCPYGCNCPMCSRIYVIQGDNSKYLGENGFFKYPKDDCRTHWRIMPVGLGKVAFKSLNSGNYLGVCPDPCREPLKSLSATINSDDIRCNTDGHFTMIDDTDGSSVLMANTYKYVTRCSACGPTTQDKAVLTDSPMSESSIRIQKL